MDPCTLPWHGIKFRTGHTDIFILCFFFFFFFFLPPIGPIQYSFGTSKKRVVCYGVFTHLNDISMRFNLPKALDRRWKLTNGMRV